MKANKSYNQLERRLEVIKKETIGVTTDLTENVNNHQDRVEFILERFSYYGINEYPNERRDAGKIANTALLEIMAYKERHNL